MAAEEGGKTVSQGRRPLDLRKVRGARENQPLSTRQMREHPPMNLAKAIPERFALPAEDAEHGLGDLPSLRRVEVPGQLRGEFGLEPGPRVGHRLSRGARHQAVEVVPVSRAARLQELVHDHRGARFPVALLASC